MIFKKKKKKKLVYCTKIFFTVVWYLKIRLAASGIHGKVSSLKRNWWINCWAFLFSAISGVGCPGGGLSNKPPNILAAFLREKEREREHQSTAGYQKQFHQPHSVKMRERLVSGRGEIKLTTHASLLCPFTNFCQATERTVCFYGLFDN